MIFQALLGNKDRPARFAESDRCIFLDRDGTLIRSLREPSGRERAAYSSSEVVIEPGAEELVATARSLGFACLVVTNQPDVARGRLTLAEAMSVNEYVLERLPEIGGVMMCPHVDEDGCACRKPRPGMLLWAGRAFGFDLGRSWMIGDREKDRLAGDGAGCRTFLIPPRGEGEGGQFASSAESLGEIAARLRSE